MTATPPSTKQTHRRLNRILVLGGIAAILIVTLIVVSGGIGTPESENSYYQVKRSDFLVTIVEGGTLEAVREVVVRNEVEGNSSIIYIVPEGTFVTNGQLVVELDTGEADDKVNEQQILYEKARSTYVQAEKDLEIQRSVGQSTVDVARLKLEFAELELEKYMKGQRLADLRAAEIEITTATSKLLLAEDNLDWSKKLFTEGFETKNAIDQGENEVLNLTLQLEKAQTNLWVLTQFDQPKQIRKFESDRDEAKKELDRAIAQTLSKITQLETDLITQSNSLMLTKRKLDNDRSQLDKSKIYAPQDGLVVYAISRSRFSSNSMIEEGATVRNRQEIIKLPDTSEMKVEIKVHESHVNKVNVGQRAFVVLDPLPDQRFQAEVTKVAVLPDAQSRFGNPNLKVYKTEVRITESLPDIKPGVSARAEIVITNIPNALTIPVQAATTLRGKTVAFVKRGSDNEPAPVEVGMFNTKFIEITSGLQENDLVMLSPPFDAEEKDLGGAVIGEDEALPEESIKPNPNPVAEPSNEPRSRGPGDDGGNREGRSGRRGSGGGDREAMMKRFDTNGDGQLDEQERQAMRAQFGGSERRRRPEGGGGGGGGGGERPQR